MNYWFVISRLGALITLLSLIMAATSLVHFLTSAAFASAIDVDARLALLISAAGGLLIGGVVWIGTRKKSDYLGRREAMLLVATTWIVGAAFAALPFWIWARLHFGEDASHPFQSYIDCYFESMSGLTTTGATILTDIGSVPRSLLLWRATTHWLGGLGIIVLFVAVLPSLGVGGKRLFQVESTGRSQTGLTPHIRETARILLYIYSGFTTLAIGLYALAGMSFFDAVCHAFSVVSTGGFSTLDSSIGGFRSAAINHITVVLMLMAGANFALYHQLLKRNFRAVWQDAELRVYIVSKIVVTLIIAINLIQVPIVLTTGDVQAPSAGGALHHASFVTTSQHTGTGFGLSDYDKWPALSQTLLLGLMFIGGCAGSTAGGVKVIRLWIALKALGSELVRGFRPNVVRPVRIGGRVVDPEVKLAAASYILGFLAMFIIGTILIALFEPSGPGNEIVTASTASLASVCNVGPGFGAVGATDTYAWFSPASKLVMCFLMALGRLEMYAILVLFLPGFWRQD